MPGFFDWFRRKAAEPEAGVQPPAAPERNLESPVGSEIGGEYRVSDVFRGGMGAVYVVTHREHLGPLVLKEPQLSSAEARAMFAREAGAWVAAGLHPNIVQAFFVREIQGRLYVAAEYVEADAEGRRSLRDWISQLPLSHELCVTWVAHAVYGLRHAQRKGVLVHRDVKPENLLIDHGNLKVTDFGLARLGGSSPGAPARGLAGAEVGASSSGGTPGYMAPEQILGAAGTDHRADIYALGVTLCEMAYGRAPFGARTVGEMLAQHLRTVPSVPPGPFHDLVAACLEKDPGKRPQTYDDVLGELERAARVCSARLPPETAVVGADIEALFLQAQSLSALGRPEQALAAAKAFVARSPSDHRGWTEVGRLHLDAGRSEDSRAATLASLKLNPVNPHAWNNLGVALRRLGDNRGAVDALQRAIALDPGNTGARLNIGQSLGVIGRVPDALRHLKIATELAPRKASVWNNYGALLLQAGEHNDAAKALERALELQPDLHSARENLRIARETATEAAPNPMALMKAGRLDEAALILEDAVRRDPSDGASWHNLGLIALQRRDLNNVIRCFGAVEQLDPKDGFALKHLARAVAQTGDSARAIDICRRMEALPDGAVDGVTLRAQILDGTGRHVEAVEVLNRFLRRFPTADAVWFVLGDLHVRAGEYQAAVPVFERAEELLIQAGGGRGKNLASVRDALRQCRAASLRR